ncbi:HlyD family secretion protein [Acidipila rosea]|uniref:HlyD family secretion protein n=2 Tax=Acidipila rosea TaxID=768535 RepID=A0A4R1L3Z4_9BACT|nr:HlyD family secretion protein [Acidipila rosea]
MVAGKWKRLYLRMDPLMANTSSISGKNMAAAIPQSDFEGAKPNPAGLSQRKGHRRKVWIVLLVALVIVAAAVVIRLMRPVDAPRFETAKVERGAIQAFVTATGNLNPVVNVQVGSQVSGNIKALYADFNTKVKKGQLIAQIDPALFQAQVDVAEASVRNYDAAVMSSEAQYAKASADASSAEAARMQTLAVAAKDRATLVNLSNQWDRTQELYKEGIASLQDYDAAKASYDAAQAQLASDQAQIDAEMHNIQSAKAQVAAAHSQRDAATAQAQQARASLAQARINLDHTRIVAPVSGIVIARHFDVGQTVAASFQAPDIFDIGEDLTKMQVDTNVDEADVGAIRAEQSADFTVDAYPGMVFHGTVADVRRAPINAQNVVTYDVVISVANPEMKLFPGMTAKVTIMTSREDSVLKVPNAALRFRPSAELLAKMKASATSTGLGSRLYLLSDSEVLSVPVSAGISDGRFTAVTSPDLKEGDAVILRSAVSKKATPTTTAPGMRRLP